MATYYVTSAGSNSNNGTSVGTAFATVDHAVNTIAVGGDTVVVSGTLHQKITLTKIFSAAARLTIIPHPTNGGLIDGAFTLPVGTPAFTNPSDGKTAHFIPLVVINGQYITWQVDVQESLGRGIGGTGSHITISDCTIDWCRNACINFQDCSDITITNVEWYHGGSYQEANPGTQNWPVCCHILRVNTAVVSNCTGGLNWGEGLASGRGCTNITFSDNILYDNFSVNLYGDRAVSTKFFRNLVFCTGTVSGVPRCEGIVLRNETYSGAQTPTTNGVDIAHNLAVGCSKGIVLGSSELAGELLSNVRVLFNTIVNATANGIFVNAPYHRDFVVKKNIFYQLTGVGNFAQVSGVVAGEYTWDENAWIGRAAAPPAGAAGPNDVAGVVLVDPNAAYTAATIDVNDYRTTAALSRSPETGIGSTDLVETTRTFWTIGALEFGDVDPPDPPPASSGASMTVVYDVCATSTGQQTFTVPDLTGAGNAAIFIVSRAITDNTAADHAIMSVGFATSSTARGAILGISQSALATTNANRYSIDTRCIYIKSESGAADGEADFVSFASGQVTVDWIDAPAAAYKITIIVFQADGVSVTNTAISVSNDGTATATTGITTHLGFMLFNSRAIPNTAGNADNVFSLGVMSYNGSTIVQKCLSIFSDDNVAATTDGARLVSNRIGHQTDGSGGTVYGLEATSVTSSTVVVTTRGTPGVGANFLFLGLQFDDSGVYVGTDTTPTVTGVKAHTGLVFTPGSVGIISSLLTAVDTGAGDATAGAWGISAFNASRGASTAWADEDAADTTNTQSIADDIALLVPQHDGAAGLAATYSAFASGQFSLNYSAVLGSARQLILWGIEELAATVVALQASEFGEDTNAAVAIYGIQLTASEFGEDTNTSTLSIAISPELFAFEFGEDMDTATLTLEVAIVTNQRLILSTPNGSSRISLAVHEPLVTGSRQIGELAAQIESYEHRTERIGGYSVATIRVNERQSVLEEWYETGLGRRIVTYSPDGRVIWEGFVNTIELNMGGLSVSIGPMLSIANRVKLVYSYIDTTGGEALTGLRLQTEWLSDTTSQARYGILSKVLSSGGTTPTLADVLVNEYLRETSQPQTTQEEGTSNDSYMVLGCLGYVHMLETYFYNNLNTGVQNLSTKLASVLSNEPNNFISHDFGRIETNTLQEPTYENNDNLAWSVVKGLVAKGGNDDRNRSFGIYKDRRPIYETTPNEIGYYQMLGDPRRRITLSGGQVIDPWDVQPGKWLFVPDLLVGRVQSTTELAQDPRARYIESVIFRAPYEVTLPGAKVRRLDQRLARLGLAGIGG